MTDEELKGALPDIPSALEIITTLRAQLAEARAERDDALRGKECFKRTTRAHWEALCAMRNEINEYIPMPNTDSGPLFSPEDGPIYADIAERVIADLKESRAYALALEAELKSRADRAEAALAAQIEVDAGIADECERQNGPLSKRGSDPYVQGLSSAGQAIAAAIRAQPRAGAAEHGSYDRTALDRMLAEAREKALREAADELRGQGYGNAVRTILALIEEPNAR